LTARHCHIRAEVVSDLDSIWEYSAREWSVEQADKYFLQLTSEIEQIFLFPLKGVSKEHIRVGYRAVSVESHVIYYRVTPTAVEIIRILHAKQDASF
jgi:toxin ParE1/3/4